MTPIYCYSGIDRYAIHEAGHALVCLELGLEINFATILPDENKKYRSCVQRRNNPRIDPYDMTGANLLLIKQEVKVKYGGQAALWEADLSIEGVDDDWDCINFVTKGLLKNTKVEIITDCREQVKMMIVTHRRRFIAIAKELDREKNLSGTEIGKLYEKRIWKIFEFFSVIKM